MNNKCSQLINSEFSWLLVRLSCIAKACFYKNIQEAWDSRHELFNCDVSSIYIWISEVRPDPHEIKTTARNMQLNLEQKLKRTAVGVRYSYHQYAFSDPVRTLARNFKRETEHHIITAYRHTAYRILHSNMRYTAYSCKVSGFYQYAAKMTCKTDRPNIPYI